MLALAIDLGTTQWKAALGGAEGLCHIRRMPAPFVPHGDGQADLGAAAFAQALSALLSSLPRKTMAQVRAVSLTGMAEGGVLLRRSTMRPASPVVPWYDTRSLSQCAALQQGGLLAGRYAVTGLPTSYKYSVFRLLHWQQALQIPTGEALWLSVVEYAAFLLTGRAYTVPSLAARTYAYRLHDGAWDGAWLHALGLEAACFPAVCPHGQATAGLLPQYAAENGLPAGIPVHIAGHDHLCAAYGAGAAGPQSLYGSMGTAMTLIGNHQAGALDEAALSSGLSFGPTITGPGRTALGSIQSAGGSIHWMKNLLYPQFSYENMIEAVSTLPRVPSGLLYYPYLAGSGAPHLNADARGSFIGLRSDTAPAHMLLAVYEGIAMECRYILASMRLPGAEGIIVSGGLTAHGRLLQCMADLLCLCVHVSAQREGTLYGALRLALRALAQDCPPAGVSATYRPSAQADAYARLYREAYLPTMRALEAAYPALKGAAHANC